MGRIGGAVAVMGFVPLGGLGLWRQPVEAQRVTLEAPNATLQDILEALHQQTGLEFRLVGELQLEPQPRRTSVSVKDAPFRQLLDVVCRTTGCSFRRVNWSTFWIEKAGEAPAGMPAGRAGEYVVRVTAVQLTTTAARAFAPDAPRPADAAQPRPAIALEIEAADDLAAARLFGLDRGVKLTDDQGRDVAPDRSGREAGDGASPHRGVE